VLFPTVTFAVFFLVVLPLSWLLMPRPEWWRPFIIVASFVFYGWWDWHYIFLLAGSAIGNQLFAVAIHRQPDGGRRKLLLVAALVGNLGALAYFKYYDFFFSSATDVLNTLGLDVAPSIVTVTLPIGISFYTFMAISYVVDVYRREIQPTTFMKFTVYLSFFPHLVAGPIVRASELVPQLSTPRDPRRVDTSRAFMLIVVGLFMKVVIANELATSIVDSVFGAPEQHSSLEVLVGIYGYAVQIFADFFGYTNIAIGLALLLGYQFPQNFDNPYSAVSIQDFWRRWHMTLSRWLRDYLYIPLGGSRGSRLDTYRNLLLTMLIGGLWHGAGWTFIVWGGIHGLGLAWERWRRDRRADLGLPEPPDTTARRWLRRLAVFNFVCFAWIFFRATSFGNAGDVIEQLFTNWGAPSPEVTLGVVLAILVGLGAQYVPLRVLGTVMTRFSRLHPALQALALGLALLVTDALGPEGVAPFIYFQF
jgi:D-alanyl-lipoteichoic acid acyltransferase DltB (MBOAT superfamily)